MTEPWTPPVQKTIPRDEPWKRPLIIPVGGGKPVPYTRISTLAKTLDDKTNLMGWKQRLTVVGVLRRPDLLTRAAGALANGDPSDWKTKKDLNEICAEAMTAAGTGAAASTGTGIHALVEAIEGGRETKYLSAEIAARLDAYRVAMESVETLATEQFVVNDELRAAGTFDQLVRLRDGRVIVGDVKTGAHDPRFPLATATQIGTYAHGSTYDPDTAERGPIHPDLDPTVGLLIHMPATGGCHLYLLDLTVGWDAARLAVKVRGLRSMKANQIAKPYKETTCAQS